MLNQNKILVFLSTYLQGKLQSVIELDLSAHLTRHHTLYMLQCYSESALALNPMKEVDSKYTNIKVLILSFYFTISMFDKKYNEYCTPH